MWISCSISSYRTHSSLVGETEQLNWPTHSGQFEPLDSLLAQSALSWRDSREKSVVELTFRQATTQSSATLHHRIGNRWWWCRFRSPSRSRDRNRKLAMNTETESHSGATVSIRLRNRLISAGASPGRTSGQSKYPFFTCELGTHFERQLAAFLWCSGAVRQTVASCNF